MSGDVDGALNAPKSELRRHIANVFDVPEGVLGGCPPAPIPDPTHTRNLIHDALNEAVMRQVAVEEEVARTAIKLGVGYARIQTWTIDSARVDYIVTRLIPPMERFEFPSWSSFEAWREQQERRRG